MRRNKRQSNKFSLNTTFNLFRSALLLCLPFISLFSLAAEVEPRLKVGVEAVENRPFYHFDQQGQFQGYVRDVLDMFARYSQQQTQYQALPIKRLYRHLLSEKIDLKAPDNARWQTTLKADAEVKYSQPFLLIAVGAVGLNRAGQEPKPLRNLSIPLGYSLVGLTDKQRQQIKVIETASVADCIRMVIMQRSQACYANLTAIDYYMRQQFPELQSQQFVYPEPPKQEGSYHISTTTRDDVIQQFNRFLQEHDRDISMLQLKYGL